MFTVCARIQFVFTVAASMHTTSYPSLSFICTRDARPAIVVRANGLDVMRPEHSLPAILHLLRTAIDDNAPYIRAALTQRNQRMADTRLRAEQEQEYEAALQRDRQIQMERERVHMQQAEKEARAADDERREAHRISVRKILIFLIRETCLAHRRSSGASSQPVCCTAQRRRRWAYDARRRESAKRQATDAHVFTQRFRACKLCF
jgi:hypothetical protein